MAKRLLLGIVREATDPVQSSHLSLTVFFYIMVMALKRNSELACNLRQCCLGFVLVRRDVTSSVIQKEDDVLVRPY